MLPCHSSTLLCNPSFVSANTPSHMHTVSNSYYSFFTDSHNTSNATTHRKWLTADPGVIQNCCRLSPSQSLSKLYCCYRVGIDLLAYNTCTVLAVRKSVPHGWATRPMIMQLFHLLVVTLRYGRSVVYLYP